ncbi:hypothetical protein N7462_002203 [Penicillium macrosclerotiorum]|uniref:uncharacterized protein n=1 Tax=Penicillium macrosclerotiorum TaxID=303699 RepID=UPI002546F637|nr:uncharacterized protein N7462_002203 [Penicillium macrosclerotiorum]KAJ5692780.1 hypothetical protein N7462_002203 [Penicillium macrosclerotiorum]
MRAETQVFARARTSNDALPYSPPPKMDSDCSPKECQKTLGELYNQGEPKFCRDRHASEVQDLEEGDIHTPLDPPHPFGTRRPSLEKDYHAQFHQTNIHLIALDSAHAGNLRLRGPMPLLDVEIVAITIGFDASTEWIKNMVIKDISSIDLEVRWRERVSSFMGLLVPGFPNMFLPYSAHHLTPFANGPVFILFQEDLVRVVVVYELDPSHKVVIHGC